MTVEPAVVSGYQMDPQDPLHQLALSRMRKGRDLKIVWTARNSATGVGKTTGSGWLGLSWTPTFSGKLWSADTHATLSVKEYFRLYRSLPPGSVLILDEAEELDARRSMKQENVDFSHDWMMLRKRQIISILTLPSPSSLDSRLEELADVWINSTKRGEAIVHGIQVLDYGNRKRQTPRTHTLRYPDVSNHPELARLDEMKDEKIKNGRLADDGDEREPLPDEAQLDLIRGWREMDKTWLWIEENVLDESEYLTYSREWYRKRLNKEDSAEAATA